MDHHTETHRLWPWDHDNGVHITQNRWNPFDLWASVKETRIDLPYLICLYLFTFFAGLFVLTLGLCFASVAIGVGKFMCQLLWPWRAWILILMMIGTVFALFIWGSFILVLWGETPHDEHGESIHMDWRYVVITRGTGEVVVMRKTWLTTTVFSTVKTHQGFQTNQFFPNQDPRNPRTTQQQWTQLPSIVNSPLSSTVSCLSTSISATSSSSSTISSSPWFRLHQWNSGHTWLDRIRLAGQRGERFSSREWVTKSGILEGDNGFFTWEIWR